MTRHQRQMIELLKMYAARGGFTIERLAGPRYFNRKPKTILRYCKMADVVFPDSLDVAMKTESKKAKRQRERHP